MGMGLWPGVWSDSLDACFPLPLVVLFGSGLLLKPVLILCFLIHCTLHLCFSRVHPCSSCIDVYFNRMSIAFYTLVFPLLKQSVYV